MDLTRYDKLRSAIRRTLSPDEAAAADRALEYAAEHTASQVRHDGSPMLDHAAEVARIGLEEIGLGGDSVVAAILHDVVRTASRQDEETFLRLTDEIRDRFGKEVLGMTVSLSHISDIRLKASREQAENFRELIVSYSEDPRVILIKLADRLEVMRRLEIFPAKSGARRAGRASTSTPKSPTNWVYTTSRANSKTSPCAISNPRTTSISPTNWPRPKANAGPSSPASSNPSRSGSTRRGCAITSRAAPSRSSRSGTRCASSTSRSRGYMTSSPSVSS